MHGDTVFQAWKLIPTIVPPIRLVATIDELCAIDAQAREQNLDMTSATTAGKQMAPPGRPILESIKSQMETAKGQTLPKERSGQSLQLHLDLVDRLTRFLDHPILE